MYGKLVVAFLMVQLAVVSALDSQDCGSTANITAVTLTGCNTPPCSIVKGQDYTIRVDGKTKSGASELPYTVKATVLGIPITLYEGNACESLDVGSCPLEPLENFVFKKVVNAGPLTPLLNSVTTAVVKDENGGTVVCASLPVQITNP